MNGFHRNEIRMADAKEGWYPDPANPSEEVYWLGSQWSGARRPAQVQSASPDSVPPAANSATEPTASDTLGTLSHDDAPGSPLASKNTLGKWAMILGIVGLVLGSIPGISVVGLLTALAALVLGILGLVAKGKLRGKATAGVVLGGVGLIVAIAVTAASAASMTAGFNQGLVESRSESSSSPTPTQAAEASSAPSDSAEPVSPYGAYPTAEAQFVKVIETAAAQYLADSTDLQRSETIRKRDSDLCAVTGARVENWVGTIHDIGANGDGYAYVNVEIAPTIVLQTWNNAFSDIGSDTLIKPSESFFQTLVPMQKGQKIVFSGAFLPSSDSCLTRANLTQTFYATDPNFILKFTNVTSQ